MKKPKNKGQLPDGLRMGIEALSGLDLSEVKVHHNADQPAQLQALAFAQGTEIHISDEKTNLPHEAWHVVQQQQGRVKPTIQLKDATLANNEVNLEKEADTLGKKALK